MYKNAPTYTDVHNKVSSVGVSGFNNNKATITQQLPQNNIKVNISINMFQNFKTPVISEEESQENNILCCDNNPQILPQNQNCSVIKTENTRDTTEILPKNEKKSSFNTENFKEKPDILPQNQSILHKNTLPSIKNGGQIKNSTLNDLRNILEEGFKLLKSMPASTTDLPQLSAVDNNNKEHQQTYVNIELNSKGGIKILPENPEIFSSNTQISHKQKEDLNIANEIEISNTEESIIECKHIPSSEDGKNVCLKNDSKTELMEDKIIEDVLDLEQSEKIHDTTSLTSKKRKNEWKVKKFDVDNLKMKVTRVRDFKIESIKEELCCSNEEVTESDVSMKSLEDNIKKINEKPVVKKLSTNQNIKNTSIIELKNIQNLQKKIERKLEEIKYTKIFGDKTKLNTQQVLPKLDCKLPLLNTTEKTETYVAPILPHYTTVASEIKKTNLKCLPRKPIPNILQRRNSRPVVKDDESSLRREMSASTSDNNSSSARLVQSQEDILRTSVIPTDGVKKKTPSIVKRTPSHASSLPGSVVVTSLPGESWKMFPFDRSVPSTLVSGVKRPLPIVWQGFIMIMGTTRIFLHAVEVCECSCKMSSEIPSLLTMVTSKPRQVIFEYLSLMKRDNKVVPVVYFPPPEADPIGIKKYNIIHEILSAKQRGGVVQCPFSGAGISLGEKAFVEMYLVPASNDNLPPTNLLPPVLQGLVRFGSAALLGFMVRPPRIKRTAEMAGLPPGVQIKKLPPLTS